MIDQWWACKTLEYSTSHSCTAPSEWTSHFPAVKDIPNLCQSMLTLTSSQSLSSVNVRLSLSQDRTNEGSAECVIWSDQPNFEILWKERLIITYLCWLCLLFLPSWALFPFQKKRKRFIAIIGKRDLFFPSRSHVMSSLHVFFNSVPLALP